jgi:AbrB family looped-hinge helix DNA binding protein
MSYHWHSLAPWPLDEFAGPDEREGMTVTIQVNITPTGRMSLPADVRRRLGLSGGGAVLLEETEDGIVLRTVAQAVARAQAISRQLLAGKDAPTVDEYIADRRREAADE